MSRLIFIFKITDHTNDAVSVKFIKVTEFPIPTAETSVSAVFFPHESDNSKYILAFAPINSITDFPLFVKIDITTSDGETRVFYDRIINDKDNISSSIINDIQTYRRKSIIQLTASDDDRFIASLNMVAPSAYHVEDEF